MGSSSSSPYSRRPAIDGEPLRAQRTVPCREFVFPAGGMEADDIFDWVSACPDPAGRGAGLAE